MKDIFLKLMFNVLKIEIIFTVIYLFLLEGMKIEKVEKLVANLCDKEKYVIHIKNSKETSNHVISFDESLLGLIKNLAKTIYLYEY